MSDRQRDKQIYTTLFYLAVVYKQSSKSNDEEDRINFRQTSNRLGYGEKSDYAKGIYDFIKGRKGKYPEPETLTTEKLVNKLASIFDGLKDDIQSSRKAVNEPIEVKKEQILQLFAYLVTLSPEEKEKLEGLGLFTSELDVILQQSLLNLERYCTPEQRSEVIELYKTSLGLQSKNENKSVIENLPAFVEKQTEAYLDNLGWRKWCNKQNKLEELVRLVERHINRVEAQIGIKQEHIFTEFSKPMTLVDCVTVNFMQKLVDSVIKNALIREKIPLYFQYIKVEQIEPLPLFYPEDPKSNTSEDEDYLNPDIIPPNHINENIGLASQHSYKITISFNLKIDKMKSSLRDNFEKYNLHKELKKRLDKPSQSGLVFEVTSSGVGGQMSQMFKVINRALLWGIDCLRDHYFPIAHDLVIHQDIISSNLTSPVWAHNLVRLCKVDSIKKAVEEDKFYDECTHIDEVATGDYCGFNFWESVAKSAIQARLSAILQAHVDHNEYVEDLVKAIIKREARRIAKEYLEYYPFSLNAMEKYIDSEIFKIKDNNKVSENSSYFSYDAYLDIIAAYLREGLYRKAYQYLKGLRFLDKASLDVSDTKSKQVFSSAVLVEYELCKANYFYCFDDKDTDKEYRWPQLPASDRGILINESWTSLNKAEEYLKQRSNRYFKIHEIPQSIFSPYFIFLARINFLKAKLFLFFPSYTKVQVDQNDDTRDYNYARLYHLELSRIYAAKNGNTVDYACFTAYQSFAYIVVGYLQNTSSKTVNSNRPFDMSQLHCLKWAGKLINHSLKQYADFGKKCYYQIKEKSGISQDSEFGDCKIEKLPLIQEENGEDQMQGYDFARDILHIDMSLLHMKQLDDSDEKSEESIYLFGAKAAILLFARGMYQLCGDENTNDIQLWQKKIHKAYRLFTYAWAVAEDGCKTEKEGDKFKITRPHFTAEVDDDDFSPPEAKSVRDLYPHRQSEIADLGKIFAVACHLHSMYLTDNPAQKELYEQKIKQLLDHLQDMSRTKPENIEYQPTFNGHLRPYFNKIRNIVNEELEIVNNQSKVTNPDDMKDIRQRIMKKFFDF